jgi:hypothetical protein
LTLLFLSSANSFAFGVNLTETGTMLVKKLVEIGAESVECQQTQPRCILQGRRYGIQYIGQAFKDIVFTTAIDEDQAAMNLTILKNDGLCD